MARRRDAVRIIVCIDVNGGASDRQAASDSTRRRESLPPRDLVRDEFRRVAIVVLAVLLAAAVLLYALPAQSGRPSGELLEPARFAWPVKPEMTAMFMGSCYAAGAYFFYRVAFGGSWHAVAAYLPGIAAFATLMGVATFLHWDRFSHDHVSFFTWLLLYVTAPLLIPVLYVRNRGADPGPAAGGEHLVPAAVRRVCGLAGAALLVLAAVMYAVPAIARELWPWPLTDLTSRVIAAFLVAFATTAVLLARDPRWSAWKVNVRAAAISATLLLLAAARAWEEFDAGNPLSYGFLGAVTALLAGAIALDRRSAAAARRPSTLH